MEKDREENNMQVGVTNSFSMGIPLGMLFGVAIGSGTGNLALGMGIGLMLGGLFSLYRKNKNRNQEK